MFDDDLEPKRPHQSVAKHRNRFLTKKAICGYVLLIAVIILSLNSFYIVNGGEFYVEQSPSGDLTPIMTPGCKLKYPFVSKIYKYDEYVTITYSDVEDDSSSSSNTPYNIRFGDTYGGRLEGSFRFHLPIDPDQFIQLHKAVKTRENLIGNTLRTNANELMQYTAAQFTGVEFMQGGQNEYRNRVLDQANSGLYATKRELVVMDTDVAKAGTDVDNDEVHTGENAIYKNVILRDSNGNPFRKKSSLQDFGIILAQITIEQFTPDKDLGTYSRRKRERLQERAKIIEEQQNEKERAKTASAKGERERIEAKQSALKDKDKSEIEAQKALALEKITATKETVIKNKEKQLAVIQKEKELAVARSNESIQQANAAAAKYEANAIREKGLAEADVIAAKYAAYNVELYSAELKLDMVKYLTEGLSNTSINMPQFMVNSGNAVPNSASTYMDTIMFDAMRRLGFNDTKTIQ